ncbi:MAG: tetratricopeptide repeat protein [Actinomycetota bacterium]
MAPDRALRWGPPPLEEAVREQLAQHGLADHDPAACAEQLATAIGPAARASLFVDLGASNLLAGDVAGALASWQQAIVSGQVAPAARALFNLGLLHEQLGLYGDAVARFESAIDHGVEPYAAQATQGKARALLAGGKPDAAMSTLARQVEELMIAAPGSEALGRALFGLGSVAEEARHYDRAESAYRSAATCDDAATQAAASLALIRVLRFLGHDDEAQRFVESSGLDVVDAAIALDRVELLARLGRLDDAIEALASITVDDLAIAERFRVADLRVELGMANQAIDVLEVLAESSAVETRSRAAFRLGEIYLGHDMTEPARAMFASVRTLEPGYWADKAALALGDLAMLDGSPRDAAAHWADAASSRVASLAESARGRLVGAFDAPADEDTTPSSEEVDASTDPHAIPEPDRIPEPEDETQLVDVAAIAPTTDPGAFDEPTQAIAITFTDEPTEALAAVVFEEPDGVDTLPPVDDGTRDSMTDPGIDGSERPSDPEANPELELEPRVDEERGGEPETPLEVEPEELAQAEPDPGPPAEPPRPPEPVVIPLRRRSTAAVVPPTAPSTDDAKAVRDPAGRVDTAQAADLASSGSTPTVVPLIRSSHASTRSLGPGDEVTARSPFQVAAGTTRSRPEDRPAPLRTPALSSWLQTALAPAVLADPEMRAEARVALAAPEPIEPAAIEPDPIEPSLGRIEDETEVVIDLRDGAPNPYAALAPEALDGDPVPSRRNPYAELAPNFAGDPTEPTVRAEPHALELAWRDLPPDRDLGFGPDGFAARRIVERKATERGFSRFF